MAVNTTLTNFTALDLLSWYEQGGLELSPKFQRRPVWAPAAKSYFVDSLLRDFPVPPLHIRVTSAGSRQIKREIVDGQQRLRALFDFINGRFRLAANLEGDWSGKTFDGLEDGLRNELLLYKFHVYQYQQVDDATILQIFARLNTYSIALNSQELRNGKYFGQFKTAVYSAALRHLEFWRASQVFTEGAIARMAEAQLTSELFILMLDGMQDKKASIDDFYRNLDEYWGREPQHWETRQGRRPNVWLSRTEANERFDRVMLQLREAVGDLLAETGFNRMPLFYTLFAVIYHRLYGLPGVAEPTLRRPLSDESTRSLGLALLELGVLLSSHNNPDESGLRRWERDFILASSRQTDNIAPRQRRFSILWEHASLSEK